MNGAYAERPPRTWRLILLLTLAGLAGGALVLVPIVGYVWINATSADQCQAIDKEHAAKLLPMVARPVAGATVQDPAEPCADGEPVDSATFKGPISQVALIADYQARATAGGLRQAGQATSILACFQGRLPDGTPLQMTVWTDQPVGKGMVSTFEVDLAFPTPSDDYDGEPCPTYQSPK